MTISKEQAQKLSTKAQMDVIYDEIKHTVEKGANFLELFDWGLHFHSMLFDFAITQQHLDALKKDGFNITEVVEKETTGLFWNKKVEETIFYIVDWK